MNIVEVATRRYTTKKYDVSKKISEEHIKQLCSVLRNSPSSVNSQPWHFLVIHSDEIKQKILPGINDFNHARITDASHVVIFCARKTLDSAHLENLLLQEEKDGRFANNNDFKLATDKGRKHFVELNSNTPEQQLAWKEKQIYIALGNLLLGAALLGIDSTPIEGINNIKLNETLALEQKGLTSVVVASLGYHAIDDFNAKLPKSRLPEEQIFTFM